jgi:cytochrome oxidase Cu insertion factor (SCO1/SenC/PrrC family)
MECRRRPARKIRLPARADRRLAGAAALAALVLAVATVPAAGSEGPAHSHAEPVVLAPGYADLGFDAPTPGTYRLPPLGDAADGVVLGSQGRQVRLHDLTGDRVVLLSFIYTTCTDVNGCPLATHVFSKVATRLSESKRLADRVRLLTLSFDPHHDTPQVMASYRARYRQPGVDWRFLTARSLAELDPILDAYDQWVLRDRDEAGNLLGTMSHVLRVYLIDAERRIRNIYSVSFLHADTIASDVETLLMEQAH